jgi:hypothetical protein
MTEPKKPHLDKVELQRLRAIDAAAAMAEYHAGKAADLQNMAQLKALRLAKEATDRIPAPSQTRGPQKGKTATAIAPPMRKSESP